MNLILAREEEIINDSVVLTDHRADHIVKILQCDVGDSIRFGVIGEGYGTALITDLKKKHPRSVTLKIERKDEVCALPVIDMIVALARPIMLRRILSQAAALGVGRLFFIHANRVEKSFWEASLLERENYEEHLIQGLEQAIDTRMPDVSFHRRFKPFVEDFLPSIVDGYTHRLLAHPEGGISLSAALGSVHGRVLIAIGPEGGWVPFEVDKFRDAGFQCCTLGPRILKVDTAVIALHSRVSQILEINADSAT